LLDADMSSHALVQLLTELGHDVVAGGLDPQLAQLDDPMLFVAAQEERRLLVTHNAADFPDILREWAEAGRSHHGCIVSHVATNDYGEMRRRFARGFTLLPAPADWVDRACHL
jgi:hypothetical protein